METKLAELTLAEKLLITGNILGSISMGLISIGAILRKSTSDLPDTPLFNSGANEAGAIPKAFNRNTNHSNYWEK